MHTMPIYSIEGSGWAVMCIFINTPTCIHATSISLWVPSLRTCLCHIPWWAFLLGLAMSSPMASRNMFLKSCEKGTEGQGRERSHKKGRGGGHKSSTERPTGWLRLSITTRLTLNDLEAVKLTRFFCLIQASMEYVHPPSIYFVSSPSTVGTATNATPPETDKIST